MVNDQLSTDEFVVNLQIRVYQPNVAGSVNQRHLPEAPVKPYQTYDQARVLMYQYTHHFL